MRAALLTLCPILLLAVAACRREADAPQPQGQATPASARTAAAAPPSPASAGRPASSTTTALPPDAGSAARFDGYGDLRFGMRAAEATQAWGGELRAVPSASEPCHYLLPKWAKVPAELALMVENGRFVRYDVGTAREVAPGGGAVGMDADEIARRYPGVEHRPHKYVEGAQVLRVRDPAGGSGVLVFETDADGKVTAWRAGVAPQVDYVEGCS